MKTIDLTPLPSDAVEHMLALRGLALSDDEEGDKERERINLIFGDRWKHDRAAVTVELQAALESLVDRLP